MSIYKDMNERSALEVSVIIPSGRPHSAEKTVQSILEQSSFLENIEIILVGASLDVLKKHFSGRKINFVDLEERLNPAATRIAGVEVARGNYFLFVDDDIELAHDFLEKLIPYLKNKKFGGIGARLPGKEESYFSRVTDYCNFWSQQTRKSGKRQWLYSAVLLIPSNVYDEVGGFNVEFEVGEDVDLTSRIYRKGHSIEYVAELVGFHNHGRTNLKRVVDYFWQNGRLARFKLKQTKGFHVFSIKRLILGTVGGLYNMARLNWKDRGVMTWYFPAIFFMYMVFNVSLEFHYQKYQKSHTVAIKEKMTVSRLLYEYIKEYVIVIALVATYFIYVMMR